MNVIRLFRVAMYIYLFLALLSAYGQWHLPWTWAFMAAVVTLVLTGLLMIRDDDEV